MRGSTDSKLADSLYGLLLSKHGPMLAPTGATQASQAIKVAEVSLAAGQISQSEFDLIAAKMRLGVHAENVELHLSKSEGEARDPSVEARDTIALVRRRFVG